MNTFVDREVMMNQAPSGLLFFPVTPFFEDQSINFNALESHVESGISFNPGGVFVACGAGEFHALSEQEVVEIAKVTVKAVNGRVPVFLGVGGPIQSAKNMARLSEDVGIDGLLVFPPYMVTPSQDGLKRYFVELAQASNLPWIAYNRPGSVLTPDSVAELVEIETLIGIKDGLGDMQQVSAMMDTVSSWKNANKSTRSITFMNGTPTAELCALKFRDLGVLTYSSAILSFAPEISVFFYKSLIEKNDAKVNSLLESFYNPLAALRDEIEGGAISIIKAGNRVRGRDYGGMRAPFLDFNGDQTMRLNSLIKAGMEIVQS